MKFTKSDAQKIAKVLRTKSHKVKNFYRFRIGKTTLEVYPKIKIGEKFGTLVSAFTPYSHLQLHFCTGYVASEILGEVTFLGEVNGKISGLIVEANGGCHLYANIDAKILSADFTKLEPEIMIPGIALSLSELLLDKKEKR
ncbi:MAG: hypothetical protein RMJ81_06740 [Candidatus Kryptonium sp.]|nr:hypothetical protein [Candidatus Kryptonium sp.]MCX7762252.1 hypothetical protein [Candidatus Kryptonium sp.]MDW8109329.1 hypothetical protein [Candidatus Kryptonium sp.]